MDAKWIALIVFVAIIMAVVGASAQDMNLALDRAGESTMDPNVDYLVTYSEAWQSNPWGTLVNPVANTRLFRSLFGLIISQHALYSVFPQNSAWLWIWMVIWIPIAAMIVFGILMLFFAILQRIIS